MLMLRSKHRQIIADAEDMAALRLENNNGLRKQLAEAQTKIRHLLETVEAMEPNYVLGRKRRANMDADNARKRARRAAK